MLSPQQFGDLTMRYEAPDMDIPRLRIAATT